MEGSWSFWRTKETTSSCRLVNSHRCYLNGLWFSLFLLPFQLLLLCCFLEFLLKLFLLSLDVRIVTVSVGVKAAGWIFIRGIELCCLLIFLLLLFDYWVGISCLLSGVWIISSIGAKLIFIVVTKFINVLTSESSIFTSCSGSWAGRQRSLHILSWIWRHTWLNSSELISRLFSKFSFILQLAGVL